MFTDMVGSTELKARMEGTTTARRDQQYRSKIKKPHDRLITDGVKQAGGHEANHTGDGFVFTFADAEAAVLCGVNLQHQLALAPIETPLGPLQIRVGLHTGLVDAAEGDHTSSALDKAARVVGHCGAGQVLVSRETHALVVGKLQGVEFRQAGTFDLKGLEPETIFEVRRASAAADIALFQNPYEFDTTASRSTFKGRQTEIAELLDAIESGTHTAVFGLQRMGKTSLIEEGLKEGLERRPDVGRRVLMVKIDLQGLGGDQVKYRDLLHAIIEAIAEKLTALGIGRELDDLRAHTHELFAAARFQRGDRTQFFSMFARLIRGFASAAHRRIVLFIDEFSEVRKVIERNKVALVHNPLRTANLLPHDMYIDIPFMHHLSSLLRDQELKRNFTLIVSVRPFMAQYDFKEDLQVLKLMKPITLYYLDEQAARALISEPLAGRVGYEAGAVDYLGQLTAGHPYLLQFILKLLVDRIKREGRRTIALADIQSVEERMLSEGPAYDAQFAVLISDYSVADVMNTNEARLGRGTLAFIAHFGSQQPDGWVYQEQIFEGLSAHKIRRENCSEVLDQLTRTKILEEQSQGGQLNFRIAIPLLRKRFVRQNLYWKYFR
jgi:class 3 adenylate cyclase